HRLRYALALSIPAAAAEPIRGHVRIELTLDPGSGWPAIDFAPEPDEALSRTPVTRLALNGTETDFELIEGHICVTSEALRAGDHVIEIDFLSSQKALTRRTDLVYTLFVPAGAHRVFPCFDQPDLKAPLALELEIPCAWEAVANSPELGRTDEGRLRRYRFADSEPLAPYLFAFAAGRFEQDRANIDGRELHMLHQSDDTRLLADNRDEIYRLHAEALQFLEAYTGVPQPFAKFAFVLIPDFEFGGMEHPGCIFYRETLILLDATATEADHLRRANLIAHETAHLWFGDLVTMRWFGDVWLKEVFANFMADKFLDRQFPDVDHELGFVLRHFPPAYAIDRSEGTHAIQRSLANLDAAAELYDALIYHKAPIAMAALETEIGEDAMRAGLRAYLADYRFANADWQELCARLEQATGRELGGWSRRWIQSPGKPALATPREAGGTIEYGSRELDAAETEHLLHVLESSHSPLERAAAWIDLYESMLAGDIEPARLVTAAVTTLETEPTDLLLSRLLDDLEEIYWRFLATSQRSLTAAAVERLLRLRLDTATGREQSSRWIRALARFALTRSAAAGLESVWRGEHADHGWPAESVAVELAVRLALLEPDRADEILACQTVRTVDENRRRRLHFVAPALADQRTKRDAFFERLVSGEGRGVWAVSALGLLCHPLRADEAIDYLEPGIEHAATLARHNEVFLPRQWLTALFLGHGTAEAERRIRGMVRRYEGAPGFRSLILETADPVFRAAAIRERSVSR
ncbi:MAG: M1 family aminopeptidase, partial [Gammaproteobacteria bacterium]